MQEMTKSIIITGGASGIGLAITRYFASQSNHRIAILDINASAGAEVMSSLETEYSGTKFVFHKCDVSSWDEQSAIFAQVYHDFGRIDIVMANAGISEPHRLLALDEDEPSKPNLATLNVNMVGVIYSVKLGAHYINKNAVGTTSTSRSKGSIICTASNAGIYPFPVAPLYSATKAGVIGLVRSLARPLEAANIQINALAPAVLETNIAPDKALFKSMILTPMSTLTRGVEQFIEDPALSGGVAEIHGNNVTLTPPQVFVDKDSETNIEMFWTLGYA